MRWFSSYCFIPGIMLSIFLLASLPAAVRAGSPILQLQSTPASSGVTATVKIDDNPDINVRAGPGVEYALVGKMLPGQQAPALGRSPGGDWVQIAFADGPGGLAWVYAYLVDLSGSLPVVEIPATPTPRTTPTTDPTLAAQYVVDLQPTRLPTFTPPPPLVIPTFTVAEQGQTARSDDLTFVYAILGLGLIGLIGTLMSFIRVR